MLTKAERIVELSGMISSKNERIKELKLDCGRQATKICVLNTTLQQLIWIAEKATTDDSEDTTIELAKQYLESK